ncbi:Small-conductance mechanosensitive channel [Zhongshania aliphaticivorans]|uniref:Small-conductance mechanosensitive channel n=1 Tax=Zhongshania aliphaticivorans TaxID=1470434 RepID=A0A5S9NQR5_9GAMM|nr:mechanosensitive ion channel domain-containing protein [Zhongshania aliphaticivorans]CAA0092827.1 Small-conductance mechanosensitive channel [Zhongshania aliphaticivorans]CAA0110348.1 Small-conductance mechanosensitive channel [Zhongshania aliphaticivorans]
MDSKALEELIAQYGPDAISIGIRAASALAMLLIGYWVAKFISGIVRKAMTNRGTDATLTNFLAKLVFFIIFALAAIPALAHAGIQTASVIAALGAAGLAVGLALQGSLANFAAGVLLIAFRPCRVGDWVDAGGCSGTVESISLFSTILLTGDYKRIVIPNSQVMSDAITNYSVMPRRRIDLVVGISYDADMRVAKDILKKLVDADERILKDPAPTIAVSELGDSSVNLVCRPWVATADYWATRWKLTEDIKTEFDAAGVGIPYPQMDVHFHKEA